MSVEFIRLVIVATATGAGYQIAHNRSGPESAWLAIGALIGACVGYVAGGLAGRSVLRGFRHVEATVDRAPASRILAGGLAFMMGAFLAAGATLPLFFVIRWYWAYPVSVVVVCVAGGGC